MKKEETKLEIPVVGGVVLPCRKDDVTAYATFDEMITHFKGKIQESRSTSVELCWELGGHIAAMMDGAAYGDAKVEDLEEIFDLERSTLFSYAQAYRTYSKADIRDKIAKAPISWRAVVALTRVKDKAKRDKLIDKAIDGELTPKQLMDGVSKITEAAAEQKQEVVADKVKKGEASAKDEKDSSTGACRVIKAHFKKMEAAMDLIDTDVFAKATKLMDNYELIDLDKQDDFKEEVLEPVFNRMAKVMEDMEELSALLSAKAGIEFIGGRSPVNQPKKK